MPRGTSVQFNKATQTWAIPDNTRFYKTFLRKVPDAPNADRTHAHIVQGAFMLRF